MLAIVATEQGAHARLIVGPVERAKIAFAVGDDEHGADGGIETIQKQAQSFRH